MRNKTLKVLNIAHCHIGRLINNNKFAGFHKYGAPIKEHHLDNAKRVKEISKQDEQLAESQSNFI